MKTIEERAKSFANERWPKEKFKDNDRYRREHYQKSRDTYIAIATEQKAVDIDKACKWLTDNDEKYRHKTTQELVEGLRKAMEE